MSFLENSTIALARLSEQPFDVLVTDMQMPDLDGCQLLSAVRCQYPEISRIVLSGQSQAEAHVRSSGLAHFYLAKPCGVKDLTAAIDKGMPASI